MSNRIQAIIDALKPFKLTKIEAEVIRDEVMEDQKVAPEELAALQAAVVDDSIDFEEGAREILAALTGQVVAPPVAPPEPPPVVTPPVQPPAFNATTSMEAKLKTKLAGGLTENELYYDAFEPVMKELKTRGADTGAAYTALSSLAEKYRAHLTEGAKIWLADQGIVVSTPVEPPAPPPVPPAPVVNANAEARKALDALDGGGLVAKDITQAYNAVLAAVGNEAKATAAFLKVLAEFDGKLTPRARAEVAKKFDGHATPNNPIGASVVAKSQLKGDKWDGDELEDAYDLVRSEYYDNGHARDTIKSLIEGKPYDAITADGHTYLATLNITHPGAPATEPTPVPEPTPTPVPTPGPVPGPTPPGIPDGGDTTPITPGPTGGGGNGGDQPITGPGSDQPITGPGSDQPTSPIVGSPSEQPLNTDQPEGSTTVIQPASPETVREGEDEEEAGEVTPRNGEGQGTDVQP
jgi:hypothetical protein